MMKIVRPAIALSPEMTSHKVSIAQFRKVQKIYEEICDRRSQHIITDYFDDDIIYSIRDDTRDMHKREITVSIVRTLEQKSIEGSLEIALQQHIPLGLDRFKPKLKYNHERQRVELHYYGPNWTMVMQILLVGLTDPMKLNITQIVKQLFSEDLPSNIISLSYYLDITDVTDSLDIHLSRMLC